jgi:K+-sensing histidine kinase KdpD
LNSYFPTIQKLAKTRAGPVESSSKGSFSSDEGQPWYRLLQRDILPLLMSLMGVGLATAVLLLLDQTLAASLVPIVYLIPVIVAATQWGIWPATLASVAGMAAADFFFFTPIYSFRVDDPQEAVDLLLFLVVALVSSNLASRLRRETETLRRHEKEIQHLYESHSESSFPYPRATSRLLRGDRRRSL